MADSDKAYFVELADESHEIRTTSGRVVMKCRDEASARHYAVLLCEAFDAGFREGYRKFRAEH